MTNFIKDCHIEFSETAKEVLQTGKELYKYYHSKADSNSNVSFYDIRMYFQGKNEKGNMNNKSLDEEYNMLIWNLKQSLKNLENQIIPNTTIFFYIFKYFF